MQSPRYRSILRHAFTAIMRSDLSASELSVLVDELRRGQMTDELAYMIEQVGRHFESTSSREISDEMRIAERIVREKGIAKSALLNILESIDAVPHKAREGLTARGVLREFFSSVSSREITKLLDVLTSLSPDDAYLKGISEKRI